MLTPEYLRDAPEEIVKLFIEVEERIVCDIAERIALNHYNMTSTAQYQFDKLKELGLLQREVQKELAELLNISEDKVSTIIKESSYKSVDSDNEIFKKAYDNGKIPKFDPDYANLTSTILAGISATNGEIHNICMSTANAANKAFTDALDKAYLSVSSGAFSYADAVNTAVSNLGKNGLNWIDYESGAHRRVDSAIRNALRTGINQTASKCQELNFDDMDGTYVEVSSHMGARTGEGVANHAAWQGKIYFWSKPGKVNEYNYPDFVTSTGFGSGAGLCGWGCRHNWFPYFPGISEPSFKHYDEKENAKRYKVEQEQRRNERAIREWKRRMNVNKAGGADSTKEQRKVKEWGARQATLLKKHPELKRNFARENVNFVNNDHLINENKLKEYYAMDDKSIRMKVWKDETGISTNTFETAVVYDTNGVELLRKEGVLNEVEFTDEECLLLKNTIVTHNHPGDAGFSPSDIYMAKKHNIQELRATGLRGIYVLRRSENLHLMPKEEDFSEEYLNMMNEITKKYLSKIKNGELTKYEANYKILDTVLAKLNKKYQLGITFQRRKKK